ncbi:hypothetical protein HN51_041759 [Arachis hypogaea]|uniref:ABC transporter G family member 11-like n=1 Tax=Arachis ipaensis TaxID=130454 RepID=UPI000A2B2CB4|nr:ABC transporter G family member 11-like [Arachis ipaensis]XP_020961502.1 ABC transporter G family member 11-like [Arachis ipaensis]XP_025657475.1 ABC transporter G family member 11-like [Arachis hypogaea]
MLYGSTVVLDLSEVFELFDQLYLLSGGKTVYFGQASEAYEFFAQASFPFPALRNPSDHFLRCINSDFDKVKSTLKGSMKLRFEESDDPLDKITTAEAIGTLIDYYRISQHSYAAIQKVDEISKVKGTLLDTGGSQPSFLMKSYTSTKLSFVNMSRDFGYYWLCPALLVIYQSHRPLNLEIYIIHLYFFKIINNRSLRLGRSLFQQMFLGIKIKTINIDA